MTQHFLNGVQIRAVFEQMRGKAVAQGVRRDVLVDLRLFLIVFDDLPEALAAHALTGDVDKQRLLRGRGDHFRADVGDVVVQHLKRLGIKRNDAHFAAALAADKAAGDADVVHVEPDQLADADAGGIQDLQHRLVAAALHIAALRLLQKQLHLFAGEDLRQLLLRLLDLDVRDGVGVDLVLAQGEYVQALERRKAARNGRRGLALIVQPGHVIRHRLLRGIEDLHTGAQQI